jgi:hypothetical protein
VLNILAMAFAIVGAVGAPPAASNAVQLSIHDGRVWLKTDRATIADILAEWARVGRTQIVNSEAVPAIPVTVELRDVSELEALGVITRSTGGFMTVSRAGGDAVDAGALSQFSRVVILATARRVALADPPTTQAPSYTSPVNAPAAVYAPNGAQRVIGSDGQPVPDDQEDAPPPPRTPPTIPGNSMPPGFSEPPGARSPRGTTVPGVITPPATPPRQPTSR